MADKKKRAGLEVSAAAGDVDAMIQLGTLLRGEEEFSEAAKLFAQAAERSEIDATKALGYKLEKEADARLAEIIAALAEPVRKGDADAQYELAQIILTAQTIKRDFPSAVKLLTLAAEQGHANAQYKLGHLTYNGDGVPKDLKQSFEFYEQAAEQGHAGAQYYVAIGYYSGEGVAQNRDKAIDILFKVANQNAFEMARQDAEERLVEIYQRLSLSIDYSLRGNFKNAVKDQNTVEVHKQRGRIFDFLAERAKTEAAADNQPKNDNP